MYDFSRKLFIVLYSINWPNFIVWLPLLCEILGNMCIAIVRFQDLDIINCEIILIFLVKPFLYMTKKPRQKYKYLENKKLLGWNEKHSSSFLKGFRLEKIVSGLRLHL